MCPVYFVNDVTGLHLNTLSPLKGKVRIARRCALRSKLGGYAKMKSPPLTWMVWPVMNPPPGPHRKRTTAAISSDSP